MGRAQRQAVVGPRAGATLWSMQETRPDSFYSMLALHGDFATLAAPDAYIPLPDDWLIGTSDIVGSTQAVAAGRYKTVNMVGAAVISAQMNAHDGEAFPFIFGGDGAGFAVPPGWQAGTRDALAAVRCWAAEAFDLTLRVALTPVATIRAAGHEVAVARFGASADVDYAMFSGGGLSWAEAQMKAGAGDIPLAPPGTQPDLTGLSCRWNNMPARHGTILSVVVQPVVGAPQDRLDQVLQDVLRLVQGLERAGHPAPPEGPGARWRAEGAILEAHATRGTKSVARQRRQVLFETLIAALLIRTGLKPGGFDARRYQRIVGQNADFRKFDDGLKMTLDCDAETEAQLVANLERAAVAGLLQYGLHRQDEAMMTCIVPSVHRDNHMHFVDGAAGGYTSAAAQLKTR